MSTDLLSDGPRLSVVIPCMNEELGLPELYRRVTKACRDAVDGDYEVVLVNDGSTDGTWAGMHMLAEQDGHLILVNLARNHGHQLALTAGLSISRGQRVLILDGDLQDPPELLSPMMRLMDEGADVVYGQRRHRAGETFIKTFTARVFYRLLQRLTDVTIPPDTGDFRLMSRRAVDTLKRMPEQHRFIRGMVSWIGFRQVPLLYDRDERYAGETKYPLSKMIRFALDAITGFSILPLRLASILGVVTGFLSLIILVYAIVGWALGRTVEGWTSLLAVILIIGSAQLLVLGVIGEYLGRLYIQTKQRPLFVIDEIYRQGARQPQADDEHIELTAHRS